MDKYSASSTLVCDVVTHPAYPPQEWVRLTIKPKFSTSLRRIESEVALSDGQVDRLLLGDPMQTMSLTVPDGAMTSDTVRQLERIMARGVPLMVYSPFSGSAKLMAPLSTGHLSTAGTVTEIGTTEMMLLKADPGRGLYAAEDGFFLDGVQTGLGQSSPFPLGAGMLAHSRVYNLLTGETWSVSGTGTPTTEERTSWLNDDQLCNVVYTDGGDATLESSAFTVVAGETYCVAVAYHSDGAVSVIVNWPTGHTTTTVDNHLQGSGFLVGYVTVPAGETTATLQLTQTTGTVSMWAVPGVYYRLEGSTHRSCYDVRQVWNDDTDLSHSVVVEDLVLSPHSWSSGLVCISGYCQPGWEIPNADYSTKMCTVVSVADEANDNQMAMGFSYRASNTSVYLMIRYHSTMSNQVLAGDHVLGDAYWFNFYFGMTALGANVEAGTITNLRSGVSTTVDSVASDVVPIFDSLVVGARWGTIGTASGMVDHFDGIIGGVNICSISHADLASFTAYHANAGIIDLKALTNGRCYSLDASFVPSPYHRERYGANLSLTQTGRM